MYTLMQRLLPLTLRWAVVNFEHSSLRDWLAWTGSISYICPDHYHTSSFSSPEIFLSTLHKRFLTLGVSYIFVLVVSLLANVGSVIHLYHAKIFQEPQRSKSRAIQAGRRSGQVGNIRPKMCTWICNGLECPRSGNWLHIVGSWCGFGLWFKARWNQDRYRAKFILFSGQFTDARNKRLWRHQRWKPRAAASLDTSSNKPGFGEMEYHRSTSAEQSGMASFKGLQ